MQAASCPSGKGAEDMWLLDMLQLEFDPGPVLKSNPHSSVQVMLHRNTGKKFILRRFSGSGEVYEKLLHYTCPNLPTIYEAAAVGEDNVVLEEFIEGDNLNLLLQGALFTPCETRKTALQLCRALWVLHSIGAVHRDVKPDNVILRGAEAVLIDFDAARLYKPERTADTRVLGTTGFAAPEQYGLSQTDGRADIYSLGVLINIMLTGEHPSRKLARGRLGRVVERCTQVNPDKRYPNVLRLMEAL